MSGGDRFSHWRPHPWHGLAIGPDPPGVVHAYVEITPYDLVKYEVDKETGYLKVDRPQRSSSQHPALYGFIPRTYCAARVGNLMKDAKRGDGDPLDICVLAERPIARAEVIVTARVVGGIPMLDHREADDKIIGVLENDNVWGDVRDVAQLPDILVERLRHYFETYKLVPGEPVEVSIGEAYGPDHAHRVIEAAMADYAEAYPRTTTHDM